VLNWYCIQPLFVWHFLPKTRFSFSKEFFSLCPWYLQLWIAFEVIRACIGHLWTRKVLQHPSYRFWAGNYSHGLYVFSAEGRRKFDTAVGWSIGSDGSVKKGEKPPTSKILSKLGPCGLDHMTAAGILTKEKTRRVWLTTQNQNVSATYLFTQISTSTNGYWACGVTKCVFRHTS